MTTFTIAFITLKPIMQILEKLHRQGGTQMMNRSANVDVVEIDFLFSLNMLRMKANSNFLIHHYC